MKLSNEFKVGLTLMTVVVSSIVAYIFFNSADLFGKDRVYYTVFNDVEGLAPSNSITINGFQIGEVAEIRMHPDNSGRLLVVMTITEETMQIPLGSSASIYSPNLLSSKAVEISLYDTAIIHQEGDTLLSGKQVTIQESLAAQIGPIKEKAVALIDSIKSAIDIAKSTVDSNARSSLTDAFDGIQRAMKTIKKTKVELDTLRSKEAVKLASIKANIKHITTTFGDNKPLIQKTINNYCVIEGEVAAVDMVATMDNLNGVIQEAKDFMVKLNSGEGTVSMLMNNSTIEESLKAAKIDLDLLVSDLSLNPHRYVRFSVIARRPSYTLNLSKKEKERIKGLLQ